MTENHTALHEEIRAYVGLGSNSPEGGRPCLRWLVKDFPACRNCA